MKAFNSDLRFNDSQTAVAKSPQSDLLALKELIESGKICPAIDRTYPFSDAAEAVRYVGTGQARAKVVITM